MRMGTRAISGCQTEQAGSYFGSLCWMLSTSVIGLPNDQIIRTVA